MSTLLTRLKAISRVQLFALVLIVGGLALMVWRGSRMFSTSQELRFAIEHDFKAGNPSTDLLRPWMTLRYVAASYGVPQKYIYDYAKVQPRKETSDISLERINRQLGLGQVDGKPAFLVTVREAIELYRANPVATGLLEREVDSWMTIQYIANSIGVPLETVFAELNLPVADHAYVPLNYLNDRIDYPGGLDGLQAALQKIVEAHGGVRHP